jgi:hypothetical protein
MPTQKSLSERVDFFYFRLAFFGSLHKSVFYHKAVSRRLSLVFI